MLVIRLLCRPGACTAYVRRGENKQRRQTILDFHLSLLLSTASILKELIHIWTIAPNLTNTTLSDIQRPSLWTVPHTPLPTTVSSIQVEALLNSKQHHHAPLRPRTPQIRSRLDLSSIRSSSKTATPPNTDIEQASETNRGEHPTKSSTSGSS